VARLTGDGRGAAKGQVRFGGSLVITSRCGSSTVVTGGGLAACVGGRAHQQCVLRPAHGGRVKSKCSWSFMGGQ
jgi:hypothetical protein